MCPERVSGERAFAVHWGEWEPPRLICGLGVSSRVLSLYFFLKRHLIH